MPPEKRALAASGLLDVFEKLWADSWGPRLEHILRNALLVLLDQPAGTLADILRVLDDRDFRRHVAGRTTNEQVQRFWLTEFERYPPRFRAEASAPVQNKVGAFLANPVLQKILTQPKSAAVFSPRLPLVRSASSTFPSSITCRRSKALWDRYLSPGSDSRR